MKPYLYVSRDTVKVLSDRLGPMLFSEESIPQWLWDACAVEILPLVAGKLVANGESPTLENAQAITKATMRSIVLHTEYRGDGN